MTSVRRAVVIATAVVLLLSVVTALHVYLARRLVLDPHVGAPMAELLVGAIGLLGALIVLEPITQRFASRRIARLVAWPAFLWMGVAFFLLLGTLASGILLSAAARSAAARSHEGEAIALGSHAARVRAGAVSVFAIVASAIALASARRPPSLRRVEVDLERWPRRLDGFCIVQVSDVHIGSILGRSFAESIVARVNALDPDLVAVTGDLVDGDVAQLRREVEPFASLRARHGVFFTTGNHDYYSGADPWLAQVRELGMHPLRNQRVTIGEGEASFDLAGVDDHHASLFGGDHGEDVPRALAGRDPRRAVVLLAHDPSTFRKAAELDVDLQISGHTHGGQIWPFRYLVRLAVPYLAGRYRKGSSQLYVSRGTGFWGPPMRLLAPAEITQIVLRSSSPPTS